jgi:hypothetical protein
MINGFMVLVGKEENCGTFAYVKTEEEAKNWANNTKNRLKGFVKEGYDKVFIKKIKLMSCSNPNCKELIPIKEFYCLRCEKIMYDTQHEEEDEEENDEDLEDE